MTSPYLRDIRRLIAIFHSPKRTFAGIGETPGVAVVAAVLLLLLAVASASGGNPAGGSGVTAAFLVPALVAIGWPFVVSGLYLFVFDLFGAEARYRVILSVALHAMWFVLVVDLVLGLAGQLVVDGNSFGVRERLISSFGVDAVLARELGFMLDPLEIGRLLLMGLGFAIALDIARWMCFAVVFAGWLGFHLLPVIRFLLF
ncbi:MAG: hypothetical protein F4228_04445 [Acidobacteria bacterium]|nr:hypothetical protein [Acidobacteriota bacterium]MYF13931.1 hypothetical protein [Acidobacteriota bacterium]MYI97869.1 hypothetical protein [Acidobacteriota bacterium]